MGDRVLQDQTHVARTVRMFSGDTIGMDLGDLRAFVAKCEGMDDRTDLSFEKIRVKSEENGTYWARGVSVSERIR